MSAHSSLPFSHDTPWLAPLAGWSDLPFRLLCREYGAAVCCTEMVSAKGLIYKSPGTETLLQTIPEDTPLIVQLFGSEASYLEEATKILVSCGYTWFDYNMGCSVPKVTRSGAGVSMMKNIQNTIAVAKAMIRAAGTHHVGFKLRLGWDESNENWPVIAKTLEELGAGWITLHPRTAKQGFTGTANWEKLLQLKKMLHIPVLASGDLFTAKDGLCCLEHTEADTVMYARGALRDPSIFTVHKRLLKGEYTDSFESHQLLSRILRHTFLARKYSSKHTALLKMRTIIPRYIRHLEGAKQLRLDIMNCHEWNTFETVLQRFFEKEIFLSKIKDYPLEPTFLSK